MQHRPKRSLGQNFLRDKNVIERIVAALEITATDQVVEIGPGEGALTALLVEEASRVVAIEFDRELAPDLARRFERKSGFRVIEADALEVEFAALVPDAPAEGVKLVANLPYNISTPILQRLISQRETFSRLVLMFQREVVERITAQAGTRDRGYLSVITQNAFDIEYLFDVEPRAFVPVPKVWSAVVRMTPRPRGEYDERLKEVVSVAFAQKRKTLANNLKSTHPDPAQLLRDVGLGENVRAEQLSLDNWHSLVRRL